MEKANTLSSEGVCVQPASLTGRSEWLLLSLCISTPPRALRSLRTPRCVLFSCTVALLLLMEHGCILAAGQPSLISRDDRLTFVKKTCIDLHVVHRCGCHVVPCAECCRLRNAFVLAEEQASLSPFAAASSAGRVPGCLCTPLPIPGTVLRSPNPGKWHWVMMGLQLWLLWRLFLVPRSGTVPLGFWDLFLALTWSAAGRAVPAQVPACCRLPVSPYLQTTHPSMRAAASSALTFINRGALKQGRLLLQRLLAATPSPLASPSEAMAAGVEIH